MRQYRVACTCLIGFLLLSLQMEVGAQKNGRDKIVEKYPLIWIDAQVSSSETGEVVRSLSHTDFAIYENGVRQTIQAWDRSPKRLSLLVLVDPVGEHDDISAMKNRLKALRSALAHDLRSGDQVSVLSMAERPILLQPFTSQKGLMLAALDKVLELKNARPMRPLEIADSLQAASSGLEAQGSRERRQAIVLVSALTKDVADNVVLPESVVRALVATGTLFCWGGPAALPSHSPDLGGYAFNNLSISALVPFTGGENVGGNWRAFLDRLRMRHRLACIPFGKEGEWVRIKLEVKAPPPQAERDLVLAYNWSAVIPPSR